MRRPLSTMALFVALLLGWMSLGTAQDPGLEAPVATAKCGPIDPPTSGWVRVDGTWDHCGTSTDLKAEVILYKKGPPVEQIHKQTAEPVGGKGSLGSDVQNSKMKKGDVVYAVTKIYDKNGGVIVEKQSDDYTVP